MPESLPNVAILGGTGKEGSGLALRWARAGYPLIIGSRQAERAVQAAKELTEKVPAAQVRGVDNAEAARAGDIVVLTVPHAAQISTLEGVKDELNGKILVDATARVDWRKPRPPEGKAAARMAQELLGPNVRVVAAFQNIPATALMRPEQQLESDVLVCGDDPDARAEVVRLAQAAGMEAYEAGGLDNAIVVEGLTALILSMNKRYKSNVCGVRVTGVVK
jgi:8-hydroxy-5-deazaflavin:NADPH oxidoreductase